MQKNSFQNSRAADEPGALWRARDCAVYLSISLDGWKWRVRTGEAPAGFKIGKSRFWRKNDIVEWVAGHENSARDAEVA